MIICTDTLKLEYCKKWIHWIQKRSCIRFMATIFSIKSMVWIMLYSITFGLQKAKSQIQNKHLRTSWTCKASHLTCLRYRNLQNIRIRTLQIFCYDSFTWSKVGRIAPESPNLFQILIWYSFLTRLKFFVAESFYKKNQKKIWRIRIFLMFWCCEQVNYFFFFWNVL